MASVRATARDGPITSSLVHLFVFVLFVGIVYVYCHCLLASLLYMPSPYIAHVPLTTTHSPHQCTLKQTHHFIEDTCSRIWSRITEKYVFSSFRNVQPTSHLSPSPTIYPPVHIGFLHLLKRFLRTKPRTL